MKNIKDIVLEKVLRSVINTTHLPQRIHFRVHQELD